MNTIRLLLALFTAVGCLAAEPNPLSKVKRVHIEELAGNKTAAQIRDMIINALQSAGVFVVTENPDKADAILRGSAEDERVYRYFPDERRSQREGLAERSSRNLTRDHRPAWSGKCRHRS